MHLPELVVSNWYQEIVNFILARQAISIQGHKKMTKSNILIIEDNAMLREILSNVLISEGADVDYCDMGDTALNLSQERRFSVYIVDYRLPGMSGLEVAKKLREICPSSLIIGISLEEREKEFLDAGADAFLIKPLDANRLIRMISEGRQCCICAGHAQ